MTTSHPPEIQSTAGLQTTTIPNTTPHEVSTVGLNGMSTSFGESPSTQGITKRASSLGFSTHVFATTEQKETSTTPPVLTPTKFTSLFSSLAEQTASSSETLSSRTITNTHETEGTSTFAVSPSEEPHTTESVTIQVQRTTVHETTTVKLTDQSTSPHQLSSTEPALGTFSTPVSLTEISSVAQATSSSIIISNPTQISTNQSVQSNFTTLGIITTSTTNYSTVGTLASQSISLSGTSARTTETRSSQYPKSNLTTVTTKSLTNSSNHTPHSTYTSGTHSTSLQTFSTQNPDSNQTTTGKNEITSTTSTTTSTTTKTSGTSVSSTSVQCVSDDTQQCSIINGVCSCTCTRYYIGNGCQYGKNQTSATLDKVHAPKREVYAQITIHKDFIDALQDPSSTEYGSLVNILLTILIPAFQAVAPQYFVDVVITGFSQGSIIVNSTVTYGYPNNQTGIDFINSDLETAVNNSLVNTIPKLSVAVNSTVSIRGITITPPTVMNVEELKPYVTCALSYEGYEVACNNQTCYCIGPCYINPGYCNYNGICYNAVNGSICQCYKSEFYQYSGKQCEIYEQSAGYYGLIFGIIGGVLLLLIVLIFVVIVYRRKRMFTWIAQRRESKTWFTYDEERSNFHYTNMDAVARAHMETLSPRTGRYNVQENPYEEFSSETYQPKLEKVDTCQTFKIKRPDVVGHNPGQT
ncbi:mucin-17-like [Hyperolius riggenbachi]|uniref:mucin-17-like n=1 Tax=Hyperolius riggenbachi TaxID=752182 RepID=UPI0035A3A7CB